MAQNFERITVTIPTEVYDRYQSVKHNINTSAVCTQALLDAIEVEEVTAEVEAVLARIEDESLRVKVKERLKNSK